MEVNFQKKGPKLLNELVNIVFGFIALWRIS
jgi:hypothetical protein